MHWTREKAMRLIELYKVRRQLWDPSHEHYKNKRKKEEAWEEISADLGMHRIEAEGKMGYLAWRFLEEERSRTQDKRDTISWYYHRHLLFLKHRTSCDRVTRDDKVVEKAKMWDWVVLIAGLVTVLFWYLSKNHSYWRSHGVYTLPGAIPGAGHMWDVATLKKGASWWACEIYNQTKGHPAVGIYEFRLPTLVVRDLNLVQQVLISEFSSFHDNTLFSDEKVDPHISKNPFILRGQSWKNLRQKLTPAFSPARIKAMFPQVYGVCQEFNRYMENHLNEDIDVNYTTGLITSEVVAKCAFAVNGNTFNDSKAEFYQQGKKIWDASIYNPWMMMLATFFPIMNKIFKKSFVPKDVEAFFVSLIQQAADYREKNPDKVPDNDYLHYLLTLSNKDPDFTIDDVVAQSITFFTDGFETSSVVASFIIYELTVNPDIQEALRQEVKSMGSFTYENITSLPLLDMVFQETMRKYSVFSLTKECTKDFTLKAKGFSYPMRKGQHVMVPVYAIHHDPEIYPEPEKFDPYRFLAENVKDRHPVSFLSFGAGPRICIGNRFGTCQVKTIIANIVSNFSLIKSEKTVDKMVLSPLHIMPVSEAGIWVRFQKL